MPCRSIYGIGHIAEIVVFGRPKTTRLVGSLPNFCEKEGFSLSHLQKGVIL